MLRKEFSAGLDVIGKMFRGERGRGSCRADGTTGGTNQNDGSDGNVFIGNHCLVLEPNIGNSYATPNLTMARLLFPLIPSDGLSRNVTPLGRFQATDGAM